MMAPISAMRPAALIGFLVSLTSGLLLGSTEMAQGQERVVVRQGAQWQHFDLGTDLGKAWRSNSFDSSLWASGPAPLGYGEGSEATVLEVGPQPPITTYFRHTFLLPNPPGITALTLRVLGDDGVVVYLNGTEVYRRNLPAGFGAVSNQTAALSPVDGEAERQFHQYAVSPYLALPITNVVAVELHQHPDGLSDGRFDLELIANIPLTLPEVRIVSPTNGQVFPTRNVPFQVEASDRDGFVYWVRYFVDGVSVGGSFDEPFDFLWQPAANGRYRVSVVAYDNSGRRTEAAAVYFQVGDVSETQVIRGPYLQSGSTTSIVVRWRTDWPAASVVRYGAFVEELDQMATGPPGLDHEVKLSGLSRDTSYFYSVGTEAGPLAGGSGYDFRFRTATDEPKPIRIWAIGDFGTSNQNAVAVRDAYLAVSDRTDVWLMLGDNAYDSGTDDEYQRAVFNMYRPLLRQLVAWPTLGNHDSGSRGVSEKFPYLEIFSLPRNGEAGGLPSGTELYYSFDQANVHFICLDSMSSDRSPGSPMLTWLENDLLSTTRDWVVAYWHHPPYTWGTHNSDSEGELIEMRRYVVPILERYGADLILCGHSHVFERSHFMNGHYGNSSTFSSSMVVDPGDGVPWGDGPYRRPPGGLGANQGVVYVVCGCSGEGGYFTFPRHPAMVRNMSGYGSMVIDVDGPRMDVRFLNEDGMVADWFTIDKSVTGPMVAPRLDIRRDAMRSGLEILWPITDQPFQLESGVLSGPAGWQPVPFATDVIGRWHRWSQPASGSNRVFRLKKS
jgi:hypothetical protein